ncbi:major tail protein [uncultured Clostridium sp.]|uniref:major tail protein n=1 Tax=uncultured Clostridium sp. TaxID=59620 RepID=UPI002591DCEB|nr:major tail protein [uncultured Clostridium sp.]
MSRIIGVRDLHIAKITKDDLSGTTYESPVAVPSLISIEIADNTENVTFYSDDVVEQVIPAFSGKEVTIELGYLSHEIESKISGNTYENGVFIQSSDAVASEYAIMFRAPLSKGGFQYVTLYKGVLSRNEATYQGKEESIESSNVTLTGVFMPLISNGKVSARANSTDEGAEEFTSKWFTAVQTEFTPAMALAKKVK